MSPPVDRPEASAAPPSRADVVVIGGGVIGVTTALTLAERGLSVALVEKGHVAGEQSSRNWGWVRTAGRDPAEIPLVMASQRLWAEMNTVTGAETGFARPGILYLWEGETEQAQYERWLGEARRYQVAATCSTPPASRKCAGRMADHPEPTGGKPSMAHGSARGWPCG